MNIFGYMRCDCGLPKCNEAAIYRLERYGGKVQWTLKSSTIMRPSYVVRSFPGILDLGYFSLVDGPVVSLEFFKKDLEKPLSPEGGGV